MEINWLVALVRAGNIGGTRDLLLAMDEPGRRALAATVKEIEQHGRTGALAVAGAACLPRAADVVSWLRSDRFPDEWPPEAADAVVDVLRAPGRPSIAAVANGLASRMRPATVRQWTLAGRLLRAANLPVPPNEATLRGWMGEAGFGGDDRAALAANVRTDTRTAALLPEIFAIPRLGADLGEHGPAVLAALDDRRTVLEGCLLRLGAGDRPASIERMAELHRLLAPTVDECVANRREYVGMLSSPQVAVADLALTALRTSDAAGMLETDAIAEAGYAILPRREKKLVRGALSWFGEVLSRKPDPLVYASLLTGLANESTDLAEGALKLAAVHMGDYGPSSLAAAAEGLEGDLRRQASIVLGDLPGTASVAPLAPPPPVAALPLIGSIVELAVEAKAFEDAVDIDPDALERLLDGLTRFAYTDRAELARMIEPMLTWQHSPIDAVLYAIVHRGPRPRYAPGRPPPSPMITMYAARVDELARQLHGTPPPALLSTPATVDGFVDPDRVIALLEAAETDGWRPGPYDLAQALLRLPSSAGPSIAAAAERFRSLADWRTVPEWLREPPRGRQGNDYSGTLYWPGTLPRDREIVAGHLLPRLDDPGDGTLVTELGVLPRLALCDGPFGPATARCLAYGFNAVRPAGRIVTVDAFLLLAARGDLDGALLGREIAGARKIVLKRVADSLTEALRGGAAAEVWQVARAMLPSVLRSPAAGAADLLMLASSAAAAAQARDDVPEAREVAARRGSSRLITEAARLVRTLSS